MFWMKAAITATTATTAALFLANLGFAAPAAIPAAVDCLEQHSPNPGVDWKTNLGWVGKVTPVDGIGEVVPGSSHGGPWRRYLIPHLLMSGMASDFRSQRHH